VAALVDIELELVTRGTARFPNAVVRDELDNNLLNELPTIRFQQVPAGSDDGFRLARFLVDMDVFGESRTAAITLGRSVHAWLTGELPGSFGGTAVFGRVAALTLPGPRDYENTALRRVGATYELFCHPVS
jgi:hypothetical protein